jgi:AAA ATPase containing von Willebrand factor type A (vWA) domain
MKKFNLIFILVLSVFLVFSCSSKDDEKEELADTDSNAVQDADSSGDTQPDETANNDDKNDTVSEYDDSDTSDTGITDNDIPDTEDDPDTTPEQPDDTDPTEEPDDDADTDPTDDSDTDTNDDDQETIIPNIPVVFGNICTGQTKCYDESAEITCPDEGEAFFGQDAQYAEKGECIPQKFTVKGSGDEKIVFDENLKLEWQQKIPEGEFDWQSAANYCGQEYAGSYGWRLPTPKELLSIADNGKFDPAINTDYFPGTPDEWFWTSADFASTADADQNKAWFVRFDKGFLSHKAKTESEKMHVRCVRGTTLPDGEFETRTIGEDEVVKDSVTGLMWQKTYKDGVKKFADALSTCENLDYAGFTDWRLPNKNELASIANYAKYRPASDFPDMPNRSFRTSTTDAKSSKNAWYILFSESGINFGGKSNSDIVRCVRRGE